MNKQEKTAQIADLKIRFEENDFFYITDASELSVNQVNNLRGKLFESGIEMKVVKNTLVRKALESVEGKEYSGLYESLKGPTAIMFTSVANTPARVLEEFRKDHEKPVLKAAYIDSDVYYGDESIEVLAKLKSKEELIAEVVALLQSPAKNVISALKSGGSTIAGLVKALEERAAAQ